MDWPQLTAFGALVAVVLTIGGLLARGQLWTKGQVDITVATLKEINALDRETAKAAQLRADALQRDFASAFSTLAASTSRIEARLGARGES